MMDAQVLGVERMEELLTLDRAGCPCDRCKNDRESGLSWEERLPLQRMSLCPTCGNKRCPKATFHENTCTGSNAVGQVGSAGVASPITHPCCRKCVSLQRDLDSANSRVTELESENARLVKQVEEVQRIAGSHFDLIGMLLKSVEDADAENARLVKQVEDLSRIHGVDTAWQTQE